MKRRSYLLTNIILIALLTLPLQLMASTDMVAIFEKVWTTAKIKISPPELEAQFFTENKYKELHQKAVKASNLTELSEVINTFLKSLHVSHTQFYTNDDLDFYQFQSMFGTKDIAKPKLHHIGVQYLKQSDGFYVIRSVLDGYPAQKAGLRRGDMILAVNGLSFQPTHSFTEVKKYRLKIQRNNFVIYKSVIPVFESIHQSFLSATKNSKRIIKSNGMTIGYVHLWCGTDDLFKETVEKIVTQDFAHVDKLILDIRGGYGGAWYDYLDAYFKDRSSYFVSTTISRNGKTETGTAEPVPPHEYFKGPMAVIINEGVRSGKESVAFQFKKTGRATLVGSSTPGYFATGEIHFLEDKSNYLLYVSISQILLDGQVIEQKGIAPDIKVDYPISKTLMSDPQLDSAIDLLIKN